MNLQLRPLIASDAFKIMNLIDKLDLIESIKDLFKGERRDELFEMIKGKVGGVEGADELSEESKMEMGILVVQDLVALIVDRLPRCEQDIYILLADVYQSDVETIKNLPLGDLITAIMDFLKHEDFKTLLGPILGLEG